MWERLRESRCSSIMASIRSESHRACVSTLSHRKEPSYSPCTFYWPRAVGGVATENQASQEEELCKKFISAMRSVPSAGEPS